MYVVHTDHALRILGRHAEELAQEALKPHGITPLQYDIMETIDHYMANPSGRTLLPIRISELICIRRKRCIKEIQRLVDKEIVRVAVGGNRLLTGEGIEKLKDCRAALNQANRAIHKKFEDIGLEVVAEAFQRWQKESS